MRTEVISLHDIESLFEGSRELRKPLDAAVFIGELRVVTAFLPMSAMAAPMSGEVLISNSFGEVDSERPRDEVFHDFIGSAVDLLDSGVGVHPCDWVLPHIAVSAEKLYALVDHPALLFG